MKHAGRRRVILAPSDHRRRRGRNRWRKRDALREENNGALVVVMIGVVVQVFVRNGRGGEQCECQHERGQPRRDKAAEKRERDSWVRAHGGVDEHP